MQESTTPSARFSRVTTRRGTLRSLDCPLEPELIVAEFSGELPPDVAQAVREHIAVCDVCGPKALELRTPYNLLASLGSEPVAYVPDLRDNVRTRAAQHNRWLAPIRTLTAFSRLSIAGVALGLIIVAVLVFALRGALTGLGVFSVARSTNTLTRVAAAAPSGTLYAETNKLVTVHSASGESWRVAEVIAVSQQTGQVTDSLPNSSSALTSGSTSDLPLDTQTDGHTVYELTAPQNGSRQALVAFDATSGAVRFVTPLALPHADGLPAGVVARSLALSPDGATVYVGLDGANDTLPQTRALKIATRTGKVVAGFQPVMPNQTPLPPPPSSLPTSAFPSQVPTASIAGLRFTEAAGGALVISPDGRWLFDAISARNAHGLRYLLVRRIDVENGQTGQLLGLPAPITSPLLVVSPSAASPQVYVVSGSPSASVYVLDASAQGPTVLGQIALGGPTQPANGSPLTDTLSASPTADGQHLYVSEDTASADTVVSAHIRWLLDVQGMSVVASESEATTVGSLLANGSSSGSARAFALVNGVAQTGAPDLSANWTPWLNVGSGGSVVKLVASTP